MNESHMQLETGIHDSLRLIHTANPAKPAVGKDVATCIPAPHLFRCEHRVQILYESWKKELSSLEHVAYQ